MKFIKEDVLSKLPPFRDLLRGDRQMAEKRVTVHKLPGYKADINRDEIRPGRIIPNIQKFGITLMPYDGLIELFGYFKKYESSKEFGVGRNSNANRYIDYMFKRLRKQVELKEYNSAVRTMWILMGSEAYQVSALNHVLKNGHRKLKGIAIKKTLKKVRKLVKQRATNLQYSRVYIPKDENDHSKGGRPLGVPSGEGRIYLHMYNNLIVQGRLVTEKGNQHGYLPKLGVITAGKRVAMLLTEMPNVYEADFKGFFDSINLEGLSGVLNTSLGLPDEETTFIEQINRTLVKLEKEDLLPEITREVLTDSDGSLNYQMNPKGRNEPQGAHPFDIYKNPELMKEFLANPLDPRGDFFSSKVIKEKPLQRDFGVPQGAPTSCSLATLAFRPIEEQMDQPIPEKELEIEEGSDYKVEIIQDKPIILEKLEAKISKAKGEYHDMAAEYIEYKSDPITGFSNKGGNPPDLELIKKLKGYGDELEAVKKVVLKYRGKGKIVFYADDVIYFPGCSEDDPKNTLESKKLGIVLNEDKSYGSKVDSKWIRESVKFLGMRYFPSREIELKRDLKAEDLMIIFGLCYSLDIILFRGGPLLLTLGLLSQVPVLYYRTGERFVAETRRGATLEFTTKESFLAGLDIMRDAILNGSINQEMIEKIAAGRYTLKMWLDDEYKRWKLFSSSSGGLKRRSYDLKYSVKGLGRTKLIGWIFSRMQSDSGHISIEQDFRLKPVEGSGFGECWPTYANRGGLEQRKINVFNASSFACHDLMNGLRHTKVSKQDRTIKVRYVFTKAKGRARRKPTSNETERIMKGLFKSRSNQDPRR